jgi:hypothetical protein
MSRVPSLSLPLCLLLSMERLGPRATRPSLHRGSGAAVRGRAGGQDRLRIPGEPRAAVGVLRGSPPSGYGPTADNNCESDDSSGWEGARGLISKWQFE